MARWDGDRFDQMILTCPECASRYFVDDAALGDGGRKVRCTSCGAAWTARAEPELQLRRSEDGAMAVEPAAATSEPGGEDISRAFRARVQDRTKVKEAAAAGIVWAAIGAGFAALIAISLVFRVDVVRVFPKAASAYASVGLPVNRVGLVIEKVDAQPALQDGRAALTVSGVVRNIRGEPVTAPPLSVAVLDKHGAKLSATRAIAGEAPIPAHATRPFTVNLIEPPQAAADVEVTFALSGKPASKAPHAESVADVGLRPAKPALAAAALPVQDAKPLSAADEHTLETH